MYFWKLLQLVSSLEESLLERGIIFSLGIHYDVKTSMLTLCASSCNSSSNRIWQSVETYCVIQLEGIIGVMDVAYVKSALLALVILKDSFRDAQFLSPDSLNLLFKNSCRICSHEVFNDV